MGLIGTMFSFLLAMMPATLFVRNLGQYRPPPLRTRADARCSVLVPARNEQANIAACVRSILQSSTADFELIVLDDHSTDRTAEVVRDIARSDRRLRLETAPPLPVGWCGKQHACHVLSGLATNSVLVFVDADVRLKPGALERIVAFMAQSSAALASGIPQQETESFSERLLVPLIHFVLLGFLPIGWMRIDGRPALGAGCGQLFVALRHAYAACGGHEAIRDSLHDGLKLPGVFRAAGFRTDLFDATDVAVCRMFSNDREVWQGLARNAHEGLGSPRLIIPATLILLGGQVAPLVSLMRWGSQPSKIVLAFAFLGTIASFLPRLLGVGRFRQPIESALLHPLGICVLVAIQWFAFFRSLLRRPAQWRDRSYFPAVSK